VACGARGDPRLADGRGNARDLSTPHGAIDAADRSAPDPSSDQVPVLSKTRRKTEMHDLQSLGETLVQLSAQRLSELGLPERLADAIEQARGISKHEARRRQMQYIGRLMRDVDPEPIRARLAQWGTAPAAEKARLAAVELARAPARGLGRARSTVAAAARATAHAFRRWSRACRASERVPPRRMHIASSFAF
jgi:hypothetical protein